VVTAFFRIQIASGLQIRRACHFTNTGRSPPDQPSLSPDFLEKLTPSLLEIEAVEIHILNLKGLTEAAIAI
jgi:hypothetical protein